MVWVEHVEITHVLAFFFLVRVDKVIVLLLALVTIYLFQSRLGLILLIVGDEPSVKCG